MRVDLFLEVNFILPELLWTVLLGQNNSLNTFLTNIFTNISTNFISRETKAIKYLGQMQEDVLVLHRFVWTHLEEGVALLSRNNKKLFSSFSSDLAPTQEKMNKMHYNKIFQPIIYHFLTGSSK